MPADPAGWPDASKPGYPMNPERDGWHWIDRPILGLKPMRWLEAAGGGWVESPVCCFASEAAANNWRYLGPCPTPADLAAAVEAERERTKEACAKAADEVSERERDMNISLAADAIRVLDLGPTTALAEATQRARAEGYSRGINDAAQAARDQEVNISHLKARDYPDDMGRLLDDIEAAVRALAQEPERKGEG